jgi:hypothetical protein
MRDEVARLAATKAIEIARSAVKQRGATGPKGDRGNDGKDGEPGPQGKPGKDGRDGYDGKDGLPGQNGRNGFDGKNGMPGKDGRDGLNGKDGAKGPKGDKGERGDIGPMGKPGDTGPMPKHQRKGLMIRFESSPGKWGEWIVIPTGGGGGGGRDDKLTDRQKELVEIGDLIRTQGNNSSKFIKTVNGVLQWDTLDGSDLDLSSPPAIGATTPSTGVFTTVGVTTSINASSGSANADLNVNSKGTGNVNIGTGNGTQFRVGDTFAGGTATNFYKAQGTAGGGVVFVADGASSNVQAYLSSKGTSPISFTTFGLAVEQFRIAHTASAVNYVQVTGGATTKGVIQSAQGSDSNISYVTQSKGTGAIDLAAGSSGVNISNGGTVTAVTITSIGNNYTSAPTWSASAPTTAGGVQASGTTTLQISSVVVAGGGTGYTVGNILTLVGGTFTTAIQVQVTTVSAGVITAVAAYNNGNYTVAPSNPVSVTGGTGSGATFTLGLGLRLGGLTITNAGSGYVEQPTVTLSGGGGSGAAAYATVGSGTTVKTLGTSLSFSGPSGEVLRLNGSPANNTLTDYLMIDGGVSGVTNGVYLRPSGSSTNQNIYVQSKGTGTIGFFTNWTAGGSLQANIAHTASAVNYLQFNGAATGGATIISAQGSDSNVNINLQAKGSGQVRTIGWMSVGIGAPNYWQMASAAAGSAPAFSVQGSDTNINLNLVPKGTGNVQQNGVNLALSTHKYHAFTVGTYYFDTYEQSNYFRLFTQNATSDTLRYKTVTSPEYYDYGTSTWTSWAAGLGGIQSLLDGNPASGIEVTHTNRTFRFIVSGVDGWPTNALVMLQSTWSAVAYTTATVTIATSTVIGGPFTTRQVMSFSAANSGNNWGMHSYFTGSIHTGDTFYQITIDLTNWTDVSTYTTYPLRNLSIFSNYSTAGGLVPYVNTYGKNSAFIGGITTATDANSTFGIGRYNSSDTNAYLDAIGSAASLFQRVNYWPSTRLVAPTNSVNYIEFSGATTGNSPSISAQGSDANADLIMSPRGTGKVRFGTLTATADAPITGYIEIKDSSGTIRKLAVIA